MEKIKLNIIKNEFLDNIIKLSNGLFIARENECLKLFEIKNSKINHICWSQKLPWPPLSILELKDKNIISSGRKFIAIFELKNNKFNLIELKNISDIEQFGELLKIIQLENEKIIISSIMGKLILIQKENKKYEIKQIIDVKRCHDIEYLTKNKMLLIEYNMDYNALNRIINKTEISILDFSKEKLEKKMVNCGYKFMLPFFEKKFYNLKNELMLMIGEKCLYIFSIKYEEIISVAEIESEIIDLINYKDDKYLCIFKNNKVSLISFKDKFNIEGTKIYKEACRLIMVNNKIYLICKI